jgi:mRNA interferase MazF
MRIEAKRGEIWSVMWTGLARKPRPALVIQSEKYLLSQTDILALITTTDAIRNELRLPISADDVNGLLDDSFICLDKLMAIPLDHLGERYGKVSDEILQEIDVRLIKILGINIAGIDRNGE